MNEASSTEETKNTCMCRSIKVATFSGCDFVFVPFHLILHVSIPFHPHLVFNLFYLVLSPFHSTIVIGLQPRGMNFSEYGTRGWYTTFTQEPGCGATRRKLDDNSDQISSSIFYY